MYILKYISLLIALILQTLLSVLVINISLLFVG